MMGMLIITRRRGQWLILRDKQGKEIGRIVISDVRGNVVRVGLNMPDEINIVRKEIDKECK